MGYDTKAFFTLSSDIFLLCTYACFIPAFITLLSLFMYKSVFAKNLELNVLSTFFPVIFLITLMKLSFAAMLNFNNFNVETSSESAGSYGALAYLIVVGILLAFLFTCALYYWGDIHAKVERFGNLAFEEDERKNNFKGTYLFYQYRTRHITHYLYPCYFIVRRALVASVLVYWYEDGFMQLLFLSLLSGVSLTWFVSYQPFRSRLRNICAAMFEVCYLVICMTIFPYVYPEMNNKKYDFYPIVVITLFSVVYVAAVLTAVLGMLTNLFEKQDEVPIMQEPEKEFYAGKTNEDVRQEWLQGKDFVKTAHQPDKVKDDQSEAEGEAGGDKDQPKQGTKEDEDSDEGEESEEAEEEEEESESEDEQDEQGDKDKYADMKKIPKADVKIGDAGFSTGMSGLREAQIQKYREFEKSGKIN